MSRNFSKKGYAAKKPLISWRMGLLLGSLASVLGAVIFIVYLHMRHPQVEILVSAYFSRMKTWVSERKSHLNQGLVKVKRLAANKSDPAPEIHFEFYTALPNMQVKLSDLNTAEQNANANNKVNPLVSRANKVVSTDKSDSTTKDQQASDVAVSSAIVNANDLEKELSAQLTRKSYVIQLGIFNSRSAASRYRSSLVSAGFVASVVKATVAGNNIYRVQLGPFKNQDQARVAQKELQKKGLNGIMRKIELI